ncbi:MAG TPA: TlpA disulfide reductase family protein [Edaphobacter sp.]|nr:TlpA disulfide reductase family protein [Edaphobacter sp.]
MRIAGSLVLVLLAGTLASSHAQNTLSLSGCEAPPEVRAAFDGPLSQDSLAKLTTKERNAVQKQIIANLLVKYPREYSLYEQQMYSVQVFGNNDIKTDLEALRARWVNSAKQHPDDPLALLLAGKILIGRNTPEAIHLLETAKIHAPEFPWPAHELAQLYSRGKYADAAKMKENLAKFYSLCPAWTADNTFANQMESFLLQKDLPLTAKTAVALRTKLERETTPKQLENYQMLWQREFLTRPPNEYDAERAQIKQDLKRLEKLVPNGDAKWRSFLIEGDKLSGVSKEELVRLQEAAVHDFPHSRLAESQLWEQWNREHPLPDGQKDAEAWKTYYAAKIEMVKKLIREFPEDPYVQRSEFFEIARDDEYISREDGMAALNRYLQAMDTYGGYGTLSFMPSDPPRFLLDHDWQPERALELLRKTSTYKDAGHTKVNFGDDISDTDLKRFERFDAYQDRAILGLILKAAKLAGKPDEAFKFRSAIEEQPPTDKGALEQYWINRARFAVLNRHPQDALAYYRLAVDSRSKAPEYRHGILRDDLMAEFHNLWIAQGGTEAAWTASTEMSQAEKTQNNAAPAKATSLTAKKKEPQGDWKDASNDLPSFALSDFSGKTWRLKDLAGKVVMITSWATWCAPCRLEDKSLQKFYEKVKGRNDLMILTFNVDENPGQVRPFIQEQGYTFPVLEAFSLPPKMRAFIPRTWIIDPQGRWRWVKNGYDDSQDYAGFEKEMLDRIEMAKAPQ